MLQALAFAGFAVQSFNTFFGNWLPGIVWKHTIKAQGGPGTPTRTVLHTALAAAFGMAVQRKLYNLEITAQVDHNNNSVIVTYSIAVNATDMLLEGTYDALEEIAETEVGKIIVGPVNEKELNNTLNTIARNGIVVGSFVGGAEGAARGINKVGEAYGSWLKRFIDRTPAFKSILGKLRVGGYGSLSDAEKNVIKNQAIYDAAVAEQQQKVIDKTNKAINPGLIPKVPPDANTTRGTKNGAAASNPALPWIVSRQVQAVLGLPTVSALLQKQLNAQAYENGPRSLFELAPGVVYASRMPLVLRVGGDYKPEPFTTIVKDNGRKAGKPLLTRNSDVNPQLPQAMGVDLKSLVAQVLFDPGTWPPAPDTDAGPATIVNTNTGN